jgi:hypothetical protein
MTLYCTPDFIEKINDLEKKKNYASIFSDVCCYFQNKNIEELHITKEILRCSPGITSVNKYRISSDSMGAGKRSSYRCICMCNVPSDKIYIDFIYPKTGSEGSENLTKDGIKKISKDIIKSIQNNKIFEIDFNKKQIKDSSGKIIKG